MFRELQTVDCFFFFQAEDGIRDLTVTGVQTCALPISNYCLLARRMAERGVRFIQLYHRGWDQHNNLPKRIKEQCKDTDQASAALVKEIGRASCRERV